MTNYAFRYVAEEPLISDENIRRLDRIFELPIERAIELTHDELEEDDEAGLAE
jgi:hypothetical protein